ncbi:MAG: Gfo/Idh/MocA family oxidoreductase, partial [Oscillospiraceae bacterium]
EDIVLEMRDGSVVKYLVGKISTNNNQIKSGIIDEFVDSIRMNRTPLITGTDGHNTLAVIVACIESSKLGKWVPVKF